MFEQSKKDAKLVDYSSFDQLHCLVRSKSLEVKCEHCDYTARNKARLKNTLNLFMFSFGKFVKSGTVESNIEEKRNLQDIINLFMQIVTKH